MILSIVIDELAYDVEVPEQLIKDAEEFYSKMDKDMDNGWQLSRDWIANPDLQLRCQIVADKVLDGFEKENEQLIVMMCGYILSRKPDTKQIILDTSGNITKTEFVAA